MSEETDKFVEQMLKSAKEKKHAEPQTRSEGVDHSEVEDFVEGIINPAKKEQKEKQE